MLSPGRWKCARAEKERREVFGLRQGRSRGHSGLQQPALRMLAFTPIDCTGFSSSHNSRSVVSLLLLFQSGDTNLPPVPSLGGAKTKAVHIEPSSAPRPETSRPPPAAPPAVTQPPAVSPAAGAGATASAAAATDTAAEATDTAAAAAAAGLGAAVRAGAAREEVEGENGTLEVEAAGLETRNERDPVYLASMLAESKNMSSWKTEGSIGG